MALVQTLQAASLDFAATPILDAHHAVLDGFPSSLPTQMAWNASMLTERDYTYHLSNADILEIEAALASFKCHELDGDLVSPKNFPLPGFQNVLQRLKDEIHMGKGFFVIRGLDPKKYSVEDGTIIFLALQSYVGNERATQDDKGNVIVHIIADSFEGSSRERSLHERHSTAKIHFHNEETGDIIAWQTRSTSASGGKCIIASAYTVYNVLAVTRPDLIRALMRADWPFADPPRFQCRPVLYYHDSHLIINFARAPLLGSVAHPRDPELPTLTPIQREALDAVEAIAVATQLEIATQPGDLHFINNLSIMHRREAFVDDEESGKKRHLVRLRLRNTETAWSIPDELKDDFEAAYDDSIDRQYHLESMPEGFFILRINRL